MTAKPIDPMTDLSRGFAISSPSQPASATTTATASSSGTQDHHDGNAGAAETGSASPGVEAAAAGGPVDPQEAERQEKMGVLVMQLGGASEEKVFGSGHSAAMQAYRERRFPDLIVINRKEDDADRHPFVWYKPWTWVGSGQQVSPMRWSPPPASAPPSGAALAGAAQTAAPADEPAVDKEESVLLKVVNAAASEKKGKKHRSGLPPVVMAPLTEEQVENQLTKQVREDREKLLKSEERIHKILQGIEDTRYKYLVPSQDLSCEKQVHDVVVCYQKRNADAEKKRKAIMQKRQEEIAKGFSNRADAGDLDAPLVLFDVLACGPMVEELKKCTVKAMASYSEGASA